MLKRPIPITRQINSTIRDRIRKGEYPPGSQIPTETELMAEFGVSRTTIRIAMASLVQEHLVTQRQGQGTFVNKRTFEHNLITPTPFESFVSVVEASGHKASIRGEPIEVRPATEKEASSLSLSSESTVLELRHLYHADNRPVIFIRYVIPTTIVLGNPADCDINLPIEEFINRYCNRELAYTVSYLDKSSAPPELVNVLMPNASTPLLEFTDLFFNAKDEAIIMSYVFYDQRHLKFQLAISWED